MIRTCSYDGCKARIAHNNQAGLCLVHRTTCKAEGCEEWITRKNQSGLCRAHKVELQRQANPEKHCKQCGEKLHHNNKRGVCGRCRSINRQKLGNLCGCGHPISDRNTTGKCFKCLYPNASHNPRRKHRFTPSPDYTVSELIATAAWLTFTPVEQIKSPSRLMYLTRIRFAVWHLAEPYYSYPHIGRVSGGRDHSTVRHGCERAAELIETDKNFATLVATLKRETLARKAIIERKAA